MTKILSRTAGIMLGAVIAATAATAPAAEQKVQVTLSEWKIDLSQRVLAPGAVTFEIRNLGRYPHAFEIDREGEEFEVASETVAPGGGAVLKARLPAGTYVLEAYCPLPGHRESGMEAELEVR